jgi:SAM-dependent methyltransferase
VAQGYDASLAGSTLFEADLAFVWRHAPWATPRLLDLGCGTGRLLVAAGQRGWPVVGVDLSADMLAVARDKARVANVPVELLQANLADLDMLADGSFDLVACLFSTLGMVIGQEIRQRVLQHSFRVLRPGGRFILHVHNRWFHLGDRQGRRWLLRDVIRGWLKRRDAGDRVMPPHQGIAGLTLHLFSRREVQTLLQKVGFRILEVQPIGLGPGGRLPWPGLFGSWRAYGFLIAASR